MKAIAVVGARPNFMKAAPVIEALRQHSGNEVKLVHTGQHYDRKMSALFFEELGMPKPDLDLQVGSASHGEQTGQILIRLEPVLKSDAPDVVLVFGDVNSTVAAALCAAKLGIAVAHVEAGLRSFDRAMPEELNRIVTDHLSDVLFTTEPSADKNLLGEGISSEKICQVGNAMVDSLLKHRQRALACRFHETLGLTRSSYAVLTLHRPSNVDQPEVFEEILQAVTELSQDLPIVFPCHPRTRQHFARMTGRLGCSWSDNGRDGGRLIVMEPLGYLEFLSLQAEARLILTDSGGIQEESMVLGVPCLTLRDNTERPITLQHGANVLVGHSRSRILTEARRVLGRPSEPSRAPKLWDGKAGERIAAILSSMRLPERRSTGASF
jgi:UDP-N-acetylglucosamine 2-epimerase (non-hydrolysing)